LFQKIVFELKDERMGKNNLKWKFGGDGGGTLLWKNIKIFENS